MTKHEQAANIIAFLSILFGEDNEAWNKVLEFHPDYIIQKFDRYIESSRKSYAWGLHPSLRNHIFQRYVDKWELELKENE